MKQGTLIEYLGLWCGLFWVGWYWNPLKTQAADGGLLWIQLWGFLILFLLSLLEGLRKQWTQWVQEGGSLHQHLKGFYAWDSWFIKQTLASLKYTGPPFFLFWNLTGPWNVRGGVWLPDWTVFQFGLLFLWLFFWIQIGWFWVILKGWIPSHTNEWSIPLELWLLIPLALYTFFFICDPTSWWTFSSIQNSPEIILWASRWKVLGGCFLLWCLFSPFFFKRWVVWLSS
jgi:hypothetical protein